MQLISMNSCKGFNGVIFFWGGGGGGEDELNVCLSEVCTYKENGENH